MQLFPRSVIIEYLGNNSDLEVGVMEVNNKHKLFKS